MCLVGVCVCVFIYLLLLNVTSTVKTYLFYWKGEKLPWYQCTPFPSLFSFLLYYSISLYFFCVLKTHCLTLSIDGSRKKNPGEISKVRNFLGFVLLVDMPFSHWFSNKSSSLIQEKKPCEISKRAVRCETFSWVKIEWKISLLVQFVLFFSLLTCPFLLNFFK